MIKSEFIRLQGYNMEEHEIAQLLTDTINNHENSKTAKVISVSYAFSDKYLVTWDSKINYV